MDAAMHPDDVQAIEIHSEGTAWWTNTPWWLVSAGLHLVVLLAATLVTIEQLSAVQGPIIEVHPRTEGQPKLEQLVESSHAGPEQVIPHDDTQPVTEEKRIVFPWAIDGDHIETKDGPVDNDGAYGDSLDYNSIFKGQAGGFFNSGDSKNPGKSPIIGPGAGGGSAGRFGRRDRGGDKDMNPFGHPPGRFRDTEDAVREALKWLARHQNPDGSWGAINHTDHCVGAKCIGAGDNAFDVGLTGLSLLAFLGAGYSHLSKDAHPDPMTPGKSLRFGEVIKNGLKWLMSKQSNDGCVGPRGPKHMYNHSIAALALSEAYGMTATQLFRGPAQQAIDFLVAAQNPDRAWRYEMRSGDNDTSVTGWALMALKSAELSELSVPMQQVYPGIRKWLDEVSNPSAYYRTGYNQINSGKVFVPGKNEQFEHHESMTAVAVLCRIFMLKDKNDPGLAGAVLLVNDLPKTTTNYIDYYYWYYASLALYQLDGPDGPKWKKWNGAMKDALLPTQKKAKDSCAKGSWTSDDDRWGFEGGRVYATAINALTLEVYYRYPNVFRGSK